MNELVYCVTVAFTMREQADQLHHDNARAHSTAPFRLLSKHHITKDCQPSYSPDLAPCDFWLFPKLKLPLKWRWLVNTTAFKTLRLGIWNKRRCNTFLFVDSISVFVWQLKFFLLKTKTSYDYEFVDHGLLECAASAFIGHHEDEASKSPRRSVLPTELHGADCRTLWSVTCSSPPV